MKKNEKKKLNRSHANPIVVELGLKIDDDPLFFLRKGTLLEIRPQRSHLSLQLLPDFTFFLLFFMLHFFLSYVCYLFILSSSFCHQIGIYLQGILVAFPLLLDILSENASSTVLRDPFLSSSPLLK